MMMRKITKAFFILPTIFLIGCDGAMGNIKADDPTERGMSYIAAAIVTAAIIRAIFNK